MGLSELRKALTRVRGGDAPEVVMAELCAVHRGPVPSVGRMVHVSSGGRCLAAVVTQVLPEDQVLGGKEPLDLHVMSPEGTRVLRNVPLADHTGGDGTWHWPELVN